MSNLTTYQLWQDTDIICKGMMLYAVLVMENLLDMENSRSVLEELRQTIFPEDLRGA